MLAAGGSPAAAEGAEVVGTGRGETAVGGVCTAATSVSGEIGPGIEFPLLEVDTGKDASVEAAKAKGVSGPGAAGRNSVREARVKNVGGGGAASEGATFCARAGLGTAEPRPAESRRSLESEMRFRRGMGKGSLEDF